MYVFRPKYIVSKVKQTNDNGGDDDETQQDKTIFANTRRYCHTSIHWEINIENMHRVWGSLELDCMEVEAIQFFIINAYFHTIDHVCGTHALWQNPCH